MAAGIVERHALPLTAPVEREQGARHDRAGEQAPRLAIERHSFDQQGVGRQRRERAAGFDRPGLGFLQRQHGQLLVGRI